MFDIVPLESFDQIMSWPNFTGRTEDYYVKDNMTDEHVYRTISIKVYLCNLPDSSQCAKAAEMDLLQIESGRGRRLLVCSNFSDPVRDIISGDEASLDIQATKIFNHEIKKKILDDTVQFVSADVRTESGTSRLISTDFILRDSSQLHCSKTPIEIEAAGGCQEYISLSYQASPEVNVIKRSYKKLSSMLGEFGGFSRF